MKLTNHAYSNCFVDTTTPNTIKFYSYNTLVVIIKTTPTRTVECTGTYSQTTRRQIGWFLKEFAPDLNYYNMKNIVGRGAVAM